MESESYCHPYAMASLLLLVFVWESEHERINKDCIDIKAHEMRTYLMILKLKETLSNEILVILLEHTRREKYTRKP